MAGNEDRDVSASASLRGLSSSSRGGLVARGQEGQGDASDRSTNIDATPPPLGVRLTCYRLANVVIIFLFGITKKGVLAYQGQSIALTTLDWVGALLVAVLYRVGLYERVAWVHEFDLAPAIGYSIKRAIGTFMSGFLVRPFAWLSFVMLASSVLSPISSYILKGISLHLSPVAAIAVTCGLCFPLASLMTVIIQYIRYSQTETGHLQRAMRFMDKYGYLIPLEEGYMGRFGMVGMIVGALSLIPIYCSPIAAFYFIYIYA
ncbi:hypothetical protein V8E53_003873 [Lactarius tabidus]